MDFLKLCTRNSFFQFEGRFYDQTDGIGMGNPLAPFLASDIFLGYMEKKISTEEWFPRIWLRFIDDIFAVIKKKDLDSTLNKLNSIYSTVKFTHEVEVNGTIPFLDVLVKRNGRKLEFKVYRKSTNTMRFITSDSHHTFQQKMASFNTMIHRMLNIPMNLQDLMDEENLIFEIARVNGYGRSLI